MIIGLSGYGRAGKNTVANILERRFGFEQTAFANKLRDALYALNPIVESNFHDHEHIYIKEVIDQFGWEDVKKTHYADEIRRLLQRMGTEVGRETIGQNTWVDATLRNVSETDDLVITDCRFRNEAKAIIDLGGEIWRIERPGYGPVNNHSSEVDMDDFDFHLTIVNDGSIEDLARQVGQALP